MRGFPAGPTKTTTYDRYLLVCWPKGNEAAVVVGRAANFNAMLASVGSVTEKGSSAAACNRKVSVAPDQKVFDAVVAAWLRESKRMDWLHSKGENGERAAQLLGMVGPTNTAQIVKFLTVTR